MKEAQSQQFGLSRRNKLEVMLVNLIGWLETLSRTKRHRQRREENQTLPLDIDGRDLGTTEGASTPGSSVTRRQS